MNTRRKTTYRELRKVMLDNQFFQGDIARLLKRSDSYVNQRFAGHKPWTMEEMYQILDWFYLPHKDLAIYFPANKVG